MDCTIFEDKRGNIRIQPKQCLRDRQIKIPDKVIDYLQAKFGLDGEYEANIVTDVPFDKDLTNKEIIALLRKAAN